MKPPTNVLPHTHIQLSSHFRVVEPGQCHGNRSTERSHGEGHSMTHCAIYGQHTHLCITVDVRTFH